MTNAIEQTKREMYRTLKNLNSFPKSVREAEAGMEFESSLEAHLEKLRKKIEYWRFLSGNQSDTINDLQLRLEKMTEERDSIQLRLHAVDHAYSKSQTSAGLQLNLIESLRKELRESYRFDAEEAGTSGQVCADRGAREQPDAHMDVVIAAVRGAQDIMVEYLVPDGIRAKRAMTKLIPLLDNEKLYSALYELEHEKA